MAQNPNFSKHHDFIRSLIVNGEDLDVSFEAFPDGTVNEMTKKKLIEASMIPLQHSQFTPFTHELSHMNQRISLAAVMSASHANLDAYQANLTRALAKHYNVRLLIFDCRYFYLEFGKDPLWEILFDVIAKESQHGPLILVIEHITTAMIAYDGSCDELSEKLQQIPPNVVVSWSRVSNANLGKPGINRNETESEFARSVNLMQLRSNEQPLAWTEQIKKLFPTDIYTELPEKDEKANDEKLPTGHELLENVLKTCNMECPYLKDIPLDDTLLNAARARQVVGWAVSHHFSCNESSSYEYKSDEKLIISPKGINFGLSLLQGLSNSKINKLAPLISDANQYEKELCDHVIESRKIGVSFNDIGALEKIKDVLREVVILPIQRPELFTKSNLTKPYKGVLLFGPPGTGKTMMAKAIATESGANFLNVSMSSVSSKWVGEAEKYAKAVFTLARKMSPCVVFLDEVDGLLSKRESNSSKEHDTSRRIKNEIMIQWDGLTSDSNERVIVLAATNRPFDLDEAVLRRLPRRMMVNLPDAVNRANILRVILSKEELSPDVNIKEVAKMTEGYSGSDLKNLCIAAAYFPIRDIIDKEESSRRYKHDDDEGNVRAINMNDFKQAMKQVCASVPPESDTMKKLVEWNSQYGEGGDRAGNGVKWDHVYRE